MPVEGDTGLEDLAFELSIKANKLTGSINLVLRKSISSLVTSMNCYYSNLIEGHYTHPRDIDKALQADYATQPEKRNLQLEARAHIDVQRMMNALPLDQDITTEAFISWIHKEFCSRIPEEFLIVKDPSSENIVKLIPGELRKSGVQIGRHIPPDANTLSAYLKRFHEAYNPMQHSKIRQILAAAASHHRFLWIHPFYDGNGRVARLFSDHYLRHIGIGNELWSVSRGLARTVREYKTALMEADLPRLNDYDGRGALSQRSLNKFCTYFLNTCIDQVSFMESLLNLNTFLSRLEKMCVLSIEQGSLLPGSFSILRNLFLVGEMERGQAPQITGYKDRQARTILSRLAEEKLILSDTPKGKIRLNFPPDRVEELFPSLYV